MKMSYEVSIFCSAHPDDFMPNLRALRMRVTKEGAFWERDCYQFSIKPSNLSQRAAKQAGEIYLYHVYFNGCIRDFLFLLERCFRGDKLPLYCDPRFPRDRRVFPKEMEANFT
ncbi:putative protein YicC (plasmid) [Bacillus cereus 03BB108]|uniref:Uncharacterized protein n=1 Tax=Bacillus cereus 03BB108 TaxID=451709 RepID=A0AAN0W445_BACCE|nr:putative protein YicC [Bacillus cereus 03BB108]